MIGYQLLWLSGVLTAAFFIFVGFMASESPIYASKRHFDLMENGIVDSYIPIQ